MPNATIDQSRLLKQFVDLLRIDSETKNERKIADYLTRQLRLFGFEVTEDEAGKKYGHQAGNLYCTPKNSREAALCFVTHMDTATPACGVQPIVKRGQIKSDGTTLLGADDKAGIAAVLEACAVLGKKRIADTPFQLIFTTGEESALVGARHLDRKKIVAKNIFVLDSPGRVGSIVTKGKGRAVFNLDIGPIQQKSITAMALATKIIRSLKFKDDEKRKVSVCAFHGLSNGGVHLSLEVTSFHTEKLDYAVKTIIDKSQKIAQMYGSDIHARLLTHVPGYAHAPDSNIVQQAKRAVTACGRTPICTMAEDGSDANAICAHGLSAVNLSIGYENSHTKQENIPIRELFKAACLVLTLIKQHYPIKV